MGKIKDLLKDIKIGGINPIQEVEGEVWSSIPGWIDTGSPSLNFAIGGYRRGYEGGIPLSRCTEINGPESSGKSALLDHVMRNFINDYEGIVLLCDAEHAHDPSRMTEIGVDCDNVVFIESPQGEKAKTDPENIISLEEFFFITNEAFKKIRAEDRETPILVALDSLAVIPTNNQREALFADKQEDIKMNDILDKAKIMSLRFPTFCENITKNNATLIVVNQLRQKPGVVYGSPDYSPGGDTIKYMASLRLHLKKDSDIKASEDTMKEVFGDFPTGMRVKFATVKNKVAPPRRTGIMPLFFDERGFDEKVCLAEFLIDNKVWDFDERFEKSGHSYSWKGDRIGQGRKGMIDKFYEDEELFKDILSSIFAEAE